MLMAINKKLVFHVCSSGMIRGATSENIDEGLAELAVPSNVISKCKHRCGGNGNLNDLLLDQTTALS